MCVKWESTHKALYDTQTHSLFSGKKSLGTIKKSPNHENFAFAFPFSWQNLGDA